VRDTNRADRVERVWAWLALSALGFVGVTWSTVVMVISQEWSALVLVLLLWWPVVGAVVVINRPDNPVGKLMVVFSCFFGMSMLAETVVVIADQEAPGFAVDLFSWLALVLITPVITVVVLLIAYFPSGRVESKWLRWPLRAAIGVTVLGFVGRAILPVSTAVGDIVITNPWGVDSLAPLVPVDGAAFAVVLIVLVVSGADLILRWRRSTGVGRLQMRALALAIGVFAFCVAVAAALDLGGLDGARLVVVENVAWVTGLAAIPLGIGVAVLQYRLYDIELVISKTLVYGALALLIAGLYVGIVVGLGTVLGLYVAGGEPNTLLGLSALVVIPIVFQPARRRLERWANRVVFGRSATPYEVLSGFSQNVAAVDPEVLTQLARSLAEGTTAEAASIWAGRGDDLQLVAAWPSDDDRLGGGVSEAAIVHDGEELGRVVLVRAQGQTLQPSDERLLAQVAAGLGLALRNRALTSDLEHRVEQLRDSRRRIVAVQDRTRRNLERNLHDGAQQRLVALKIKLGLATAVAGREHLDGVGVVLEGLRDQADTVIDSVREFARGIYPPLLEAEGLPAALSANFRKAPIPVSLQSAGVGRYPREVESTVYFCLLSAVSGSVARGSGSVHVMLEEDAGELVFEIRDDGSPAGPDEFLKILDRVDAAGGTVAADSRPGRGAIVECRLPLSEGVTGE
jgi:signal transduction histidine kinase